MEVGVVDFRVPLAMCVHGFDSDVSVVCNRAL